MSTVRRNRYHKSVMLADCRASSEFNPLRRGPSSILEDSSNYSTVYTLLMTMRPTTVGWYPSPHRPGMWQWWSGEAWVGQYSSKRPSRVGEMVDDGEPKPERASSPVGTTPAVSAESFIFGKGSLNEKIVCPHCQKVGRVYVRATAHRSGVSKAKANLAFLTGGLSIAATGLARVTVKVNRMYCANCRMTWESSR